MALEVEINSEALLTALTQKTTQFPEKFIELRNEIGFIIQGEVMDEAPVITHNLQGATRIDNPDELSVRVFPDQGTAPYALYVILKGVTRRYAGNPYIERGQENSQAKIDEEVAKFERWCTE